MKKKKINLNKFIALTLSFLFIMQQSLVYQVLASNITNGDGSVIAPNGGDHIWNVRPDAVNGATGFKQFGEINLSQGDILNFIYSYITQSQSGTGNDLTLKDEHGTIDTFVALVNNGVNIQGIVNALQSVNGNLKNDGNLMFISPGVASTMFETLAEQGVNIRMISTSEIKISCLVDKDQAQRAVKALHEVFELDSSEVAEVKGDLPNI